MGTVDNGRADLFWRAVRRVAARCLGSGYRIKVDQFILETAHDAVVSLAPLWAELDASSGHEHWEGEIERHVHACIQLIEQVADLDFDHALGYASDHPSAGGGSGGGGGGGGGGGPTIRLRLARHKQQSVAVDLGAGWELAVVIDLGLGLVLVTEAHVARWRATSRPESTMATAQLLQSARQATLEAALPRLAAARLGPGLTLLSAGLHTAGCLLDLDRLASAVGLSPTLVRPVSPSVVILGESTDPASDRHLMPIAQALATLNEDLGSVGEWLNVPLWQFHSPGRLGIFEV